ncbi:GDP-L-fucose synthase family protein [Prochlorococcus marinus]|uniref:GDP-L-fucose synthase n=1 Tax=Prochlorococcus marinus str. GP2 TaxID=59925 RepID=A0A0A1ZAL9_PROMR|nr:GDP-L-fucose synthase [Prochlorococcus marinus]KGF86500.1 GDP-L-fucose synthetase [Prochlorococcus marinus str. GP2]
MTLLSGDETIYVAGSTGMVGNAICKLLLKNGFTFNNKKLITTSRKDLDLQDAKKVEAWFKKFKPNIVIIAAAKVGGIMANKLNQVEFLLENLKIQNNLIETSYKFGVKRLIFLGSSCIYPKLSPQPIKEEYLLTSELEPTNEAYAIAKIAGLKLCQFYRKQYNFDAISLMPTNLYGPNDNYDLKNSHVLAALIRKFYEAKIRNSKSVTCWGSGKPLREFLYVEDFAEACFHILKNWDPDHAHCPIDKDGNKLNWLNVGSDYEISIKELSQKISYYMKFDGEIIWDKSKPDGTPRKKLDNNYINKIGWKANTNLNNGIKKTIISYKNELGAKDQFFS